MTTKAIPFAMGQMSGLDPISGASPSLMNFIPDAMEALHVRPGISTWADFPAVIPDPTPVIGIFPWRDYVVFVCQSRKIWAWLAPGLVQALSDATAATQLDGSGRPVFTYDADRVAIVGGGAPQQWQGVGLSSRLAPAAVAPDGSPLTLTHIAYSAQRFVGNLNNNSGFVQWTAPGPTAHTTWPIVGAYYAEAEAAPDPVIALFANTNEVFTFGTETTQVYIPDAQLAFQVASTVELGAAAPFSVIPTEDGLFFWLDHTKKFVQSNGRGFDVISDPGITATVRALSVVSDCWGCNPMIGPWDLLMWSFATEKRAFWYEKNLHKWGEFSSADANGEPISFVPTSYAYFPGGNNGAGLHLVGLSSGKIAVLDLDAATDDGATIIAEATTGFQDRGTFVHKLCERVQMQVRRIAPSLTAEDPVFEYRYRDNLGAWRTRQRRSLADASLQPVVDMGWSLGMYRQRQHKITFSGGAGFILTGATETYSIEKEAA